MAGTRAEASKPRLFLLLPSLAVIARSSHSRSMLNQTLRKPIEGTGWIDIRFQRDEGL